MSIRLASLLCALGMLGPLQAADEVPLGRLPRTVTPEHVAIELRMDPAAEGFSGRTRIDVSITDEYPLAQAFVVISAVPVGTPA